MEKLHQETYAFHPPHLRQSTAFTIPSRSNSVDDEESDEEEQEREQEQEDVYSNSGSGTITTKLNDIEEDEDILLLEVDGQPSTTLISIILTGVVQPLSRQHIKRPTPVPSLTETINKMSANMPNNGHKPSAKCLSRKKQNTHTELDESWESQSQCDHTLNMARIALEDKRLALEQDKIDRQEKAEQQRI